MKWIDSYALNVPIIDKQHKELFKMLNLIEDSFKKGTTHSEIVKVLKFLVGYVKHHFAAEEEVMRMAEYPGLADHKILHKNLVSELMVKIKLLGTTKYINIYEIEEFVTAWLCEHIIQEDMHIRDHINSKKKEHQFLNQMTRDTSAKVISDILEECNRYESLCKQGMVSEADKEAKIHNATEEFLTMFQYSSLSELYDTKRVVDTLIDKKYLEPAEMDAFWKTSISVDFLKRILNESKDTEYDTLMLDALEEEGVISPNQRNQL